MSANVSRVVVNGFDAIVLENSLLRASVIPSLGGRMWELRDEIRGRQWIWHRDDVPLAASARGSSYDDVWAGGWEELFPNDSAIDFEGRSLPDHGEWWTTAWTVTDVADGAEAVVRLVAETRNPRTACVKEFRLRDDSDTIKVSYRIESLETEPFHFLFKQHLPIAVTPSCQLAVPGGQVTAVDAAFSTLLPGSGPFAWPLAPLMDGLDVDLRQVPPRSTAEREFMYITDVPQACCGIDDVSQGASIRMRYDRRRLPFLWLFLSYGGWRNCYTAVLEPCTNMPKNLAEAVRLGQSARLDPGAVFQTSVAVTLAAFRRGD
jgi:hypothetical protein